MRHDGVAADMMRRHGQGRPGRPVTRSPRQRGFTLLEVLVALVLLALFAVISYRALDSVLQAERHAAAEMARWRHLALAFSRVHADLANAVAGVEPSHGQRRGLHAGEDGGGALHLDLDRLLPDDQEGGLQRVGYRYAGGLLSRRLWRDGTGDTAAPDEEVPVLEGLSGLSLRYLDREGRWRAGWTPDGREPLPRAVEMRLGFATGEPLRRVFLLQ